MPAEVRSCSSRCRLEEGTPMRRANSDTYHAFWGRRSIADRMPWRVLGRSASSERIFRILRNYRRNLRKYQVPMRIVVSIQAEGPTGLSVRGDHRLLRHGNAAGHDA